MLAIRLPARLSRHVIKDWLWLDDLITPSAEWPPSQFSQSVYGRNWTFDGFRHAGSEGSEFYERIIIDSPRQDFDLPRIWHFASKHIAEPICEGAAFGNWVPYGFVERSGGFLRLFHLDGRNTSIPIAQDSTRFIVETRLGLVPADFRIASVHYFTMERTNEANLPFVRFK